jgi:hypothetical protein
MRWCHHLLRQPGSLRLLQQHRHAEVSRAACDLQAVRRGNRRINHIVEAPRHVRARRAV